MEILNTSLKDASTEQLAEELASRRGVERCAVQPDHEYEVAVAVSKEYRPPLNRKEYREGGMHELNDGPATILVITE